jgi:putative ABC transport system permease protein
VFLARAALELFISQAAGVLPRANEVGLDGPVLAATVMMTLAVAVVCAGAAAAGAVRRDGAELLRGTVRTGTPRTRRVRAALVSGQLALSVVLLTGVGLLVRSVDELLSEDGGFSAESVVTATLLLDDSRLADDGSTTGFVNRLLERVRALPAVSAAGVGSLLPPSDAPTTVNVRFRSDTRDDSIKLSFGAVTSGFLEALGTPLTDGRHFSAQDDRAEIADWIISESAGRFLYPDTHAIGREATFAVPTFALTREGRMLGVVADMKYAGLEAGPEASVKQPDDSRCRAGGRARCLGGSRFSWRHWWRPWSRHGVRRGSIR